MATKTKNNKMKKSQRVAQEKARRAKARKAGQERSNSSNSGEQSRNVLVAYAGEQTFNGLPLKEVLRLENGELATFPELFHNIARFEGLGSVACIETAEKTFLVICPADAFRVVHSSVAMYGACMGIPAHTSALGEANGVVSSFVRFFDDIEEMADEAVANGQFIDGYSEWRLSA